LPAWHSRPWTIRTRGVWYKSCKMGIWYIITTASLLYSLYSVHYIPLKMIRYFGGTCHLRLQGRRMSRARNQLKAGSKQSRLSCYFANLSDSNFRSFYLLKYCCKFTYHMSWDPNGSCASASDCTLSLNCTVGSL
jgi:hypothetical protein